jgi:hypothetical protein
MGFMNTAAFFYEHPFVEVAGIEPAVAILSRCWSASRKCAVTCDDGLTIGYRQ